MIIECCSQERSYSKFYGLMGERFCKLNQVWAMAYEECFTTYYSTIHRYETNRLRNIARFFGHLLATDAIPWTVFDAVKMNEDDTTSSSRIFIKILFQEVTEGMGLKKLTERLGDPSLRMHLGNIFPLDNPKNTRFSINFFTSIGLGAVTEEMREHLKRAPAIIVRPTAPIPFLLSSPEAESPSPTSHRWSNAASSKTPRQTRTLPPPNRPSLPPPPHPAARARVPDPSRPAALRAVLRAARPPLTSPRREGTCVTRTGGTTSRLRHARSTRGGTKGSLRGPLEQGGVIGGTGTGGARRKEGGMGGMEGIGGGRAGRGGRGTAGGTGGGKGMMEGGGTDSIGCMAGRWSTSVGFRL